MSDIVASLDEARVRRAKGPPGSTTWVGTVDLYEPPQDGFSFNFHDWPGHGEPTEALLHAWFAALLRSAAVLWSEIEKARDDPSDTLAVAVLTTRGVRLLGYDDALAAASPAMVSERIAQLQGLLTGANNDD